MLNVQFCAGSRPDAFIMAGWALARPAA